MDAPPSPAGAFFGPVCSTIELIDTEFEIINICFCFSSPLLLPFSISLYLAINLPLRHDKYLWSNRNYFDSLSLIKNGNCRLSKMKTIPPPPSSLSSLPPQPLRKCIKNIWTAFSPLDDLLNCVCKKALPRKWRLHSFYLLDLWQKAAEWRVGRRGADCLLHLSQWQGQFARDEKYDCKKKKQQQKRNQVEQVLSFSFVILWRMRTEELFRELNCSVFSPLFPFSSSSLFILFYAEWQTNP